ncbi:MAG TPA: hypothetical protein VLQ93_04425 [Myxococcaceae bacterium]|nr:hypothetical protein [Myxococcaceae bacterium]
MEFESTFRRLNASIRSFTTASCRIGFRFNRLNPYSMTRQFAMTVWASHNWLLPASPQGGISPGHPQVNVHHRRIPDQSLPPTPIAGDTLQVNPLESVEHLDENIRRPPLCSGTKPSEAERKFWVHIHRFQESPEQVLDTKRHFIDYWKIS